MTTRQAGVDRARRALVATPLAAALAGPWLAARAQAPAPAAAAGLLAGPDRMQKLIEGAKKEGTLTIYTSQPPDDMAAFTGAFEAKYGVKAKVWRSGSENVLQRGVTEMRAGRKDVDLFDTNGPEMEALHREGVLQKVVTPATKDLIPQAVFPHGEWVSTRLNIFTAAYNTKLIKKDQLPKSYKDLLDPKWKGQLAVEAEDEDWFAGVCADLGESVAVPLFKEIVAKNSVTVRKGHTLLSNLVVSGEVPMALTLYNYKTEQLKNAGAPIDWFAIGSAIARPNGVGVARNAPHPYAAVLFYEFMLTDAQPLMLKRDFVPTNKSVKTPLNSIPLKFVDVKVKLDENKKWNQLYAEVFNKKTAR
jgi:iron(III) transport system substrate-binding protein